MKTSNEKYTVRKAWLQHSPIGSNNDDSTAKVNDTASKIGSTANDHMTFSFSVNGNEVVFRMPNESYTRINLADPQIYDESFEKFILLSRSLRGQVLFGNVDIEKLSEAYPFKPFAYQTENVLTMLNRFDGNGVFGDQVGLGKTVEALITAHAMFESGAIRNALIIVPNKLVDSWKNEISSKFPGIFELHTYEKGNRREAFLDAIDDIKRNNAHNTSKYHLYLISDTTLAAHEDEITLFSERKTAYESIHEPLSDSDSKDIEGVKLALSALNPRSRIFNVEEILTNYGWQGLDPFFSESSIPGVLSRLTVKKCEAVVDALVRLADRISIYSNEFVDAAKEEIERIKAWFTDKLCEFKEEEADYATYQGLFEEGNNRIVDLLIVDEVHTFYEKNDADLHAENNHERNFLSEKTKSQKTVSFIAEINKKFCVLISATPVRERLEDIFELVYIADPKKFGQNYEEARRYFYKTICQINSPSKSPLADMIIDEKSFSGAGNAIEFNESRFSNFLGLINNFFTRKRISEVSEDMKGSADVLYSEMPEEERRIIDSLKRKIIDKRTIMYLQSRSNLEAARKSAEKSFEAWKKYGTAKRDEYEENCAMDEERFDARRHARAAIDAVLMEEIKSSHYSNAQKRLIHSMIDWRRRKKRGIAIRIDAPEGSNDAESIIHTTTTVTEKLCEIGSELRRVRTAEDLREILKYVSDPDANGDTVDAYANAMFDHALTLSSNLSHDSAVYYVSRVNIGDEHNIRSKIASELEKSTANRTVLVCDNRGADFSIDEETYNKIVILSQAFQAGINLQQYRTFVFSQMDSKGNRLLEPVDIEQWIGRIHRTGQVKSCGIVTVLTTYMSQSVNNPGPDFLRWYYDIIADSNGFDLYGNSTPDVAFLQPIVTDCIRKYLECVFKDADTKNSFATSLFKRIWYNTALTTISDIRHYSILRIIRSLTFAEAMEICYYYDKQDTSGKQLMRNFIVNLVNTLCTKPEFGKRINSDTEN